MYSNERDGSWRGQLSIFNNSAPFSRVDTLLVPGGASNYTLVSNAPLHFVGRGRMEGVDCAHAGRCGAVCAGDEVFEAWADGCGEATTPGTRGVHWES